jgi:hypothetical protein
MSSFYILTYKGNSRDRIASSVKDMGSWYRFDESSYIISSSRNMKELGEEVARIINPNTDTYLLFQIDINLYKGRIKKDVAAWIKKHYEANKKNQ